MTKIISYRCDVCNQVLCDANVVALRIKGGTVAAEHPKDGLDCKHVCHPCVSVAADWFRQNRKELP